MLGVALVALTGGIGGYLLGAGSVSNVTDAPTPPVHVRGGMGGYLLGANAEFPHSDSPASDVVPVGSISESYSDD